MLGESLIRFAIGGAVVSAFAVIGDLLRPKSFAGLFGAAPSVALATLGMAISKHGGAYAAVEGRSMILGAVALLAYSQVTALPCMKRRWHALAASSAAIAVWFAVALGLWAVLLR